MKKLTTNHYSLSTILLRYAAIITGTVIAAFAIAVFLVPYKIAPGGVSGLSTVIFHLSGGIFSIGTLMLVLNIPLFIIGYKSIGLKFITRTIIATAALSFSADLMTDLVQKHITPLISPGGQQDLFLYSVIGGVVMGLGFGIVIKFEATTGGSDLLAAVLNKRFPHVTIGNFLMSIDAMIVITAMIAFHSILIGLYSIIALFLSSKVVDIIVEGINYNKALYIFSLRSGEIAAKLSEDRKGVTLFHSYGVFGKMERDVVLCIVYRSQIQHVKGLIREIDPGAFVMILDSKEVLGEGFKEL